MELNEALEVVKQNLENETVTSFLSENTKAVEIDFDSAKSFIESSDDGKKFLLSNPLADKRATEAVENYQKGKGQETFERRMKEAKQEWLKEQNPEMTDEQKRLMEMEDRINAQDKMIAQKELLLSAKDTLNEYGLDNKFIDYVKGEDIESTKNRISSFKDIIDNVVESRVKATIDEKYDSIARKVDKGDGPGDQQAITEQQLTTLANKARQTQRTADMVAYMNAKQSLAEQQTN